MVTRTLGLRSADLLLCNGDHGVGKQSLALGLDLPPIATKPALCSDKHVHDVFCQRLHALGGESILHACSGQNIDYKEIIC